MTAQLIIVGAGQAAAQAVHTLVQQEFAGAVTVIGDEPYPPYQRPPLSKKYLAGALERRRLYLRPEEFYAQHDVDLRLGVRATALDRERRRIELGDGNALDYDQLLLATGSRVRRLDVPGSDLDGIHYLRSIADADRIAAELVPGRRLVIVGAGYIGLEVAAVARSLGADVTVLEAAERVMARVVCPEVAAFYTDVHTAAGVRIRCGSGVREFAGRQRVDAVVAADGTAHRCDLAVVGIGIVPQTELAEQSGLACSDGIDVDETARTADPAVFAAGDCTSHPNAVLGRRIRLESVHNAIEQAKAAAHSIAGTPQTYAQVPWFWSDQYDLKLQIAGLSAGYDRVVLRGDPQTRRFAAYYLRAGTIIAVDAVNSPRDFVHGKQLVAAHAEIDPATLADPSADLAEFANGQR
jgi:3-phenylpropionate/trans-cinnamate dioxygenase ferredoxin reductase subunit